MKSDLDRLMQERDLDGLWITGSPGDNPSMDYFIGDAHITKADIIKKRGQPAVLYHAPMEREEAAATGLTTELESPSRLITDLEEAQGDEFSAEAMRIQRNLEAQGVSGRVAVYGRWEAGRTLAVVRQLEERMPSCQFVNDSGPEGALRQARLTKDKGEIDKIRQMGGVTIEVVAGIAEFLQTSPVVDEVLQDEAGNPLTVGQIKNRIHLMLAERGAESPSGPIFAPGREGALGHGTGLPDQQIRLGEPIVFDIYPRARGGGYYYDFTRTWCLGYAPTEVGELYDQVHQVYHQVFDMLVAGASPRQLQIEVCQRFENMGHPTPLSDPNTQDGYFHGLAHGLGLAIHEVPIFRHYDNPAETPLRPGMVVTYEPGLYYPELNMGVRLEDAVLIEPEGPPTVLAEYPHDLVLPMDSA